MGAFGMSAVGKDRTGKVDEIPLWWWEQAKEQWGLSNDELAQLKEHIANNDGLLQEIMQNGLGTPEEVAQTGAEITPGVDEAIAARQGRTSGLQEQFETDLGNVGADANFKENAGVLDDFGNSITGTYDTAEGAIRDNFGRRRGTVDRFGRDITGNIEDSFGAAQKNSDGIFDETAGDITGTYGKVGAESDESFEEALGRIQGIADEAPKDVGDFAAARSARAFLPALASQASRLRRAGVDTTGPEGRQSLARVEAARARAAGDEYANEQKYQDARKLGLAERLNSLALDKTRSSGDLQLGRLGQSTNNRNLRESVGRGLTLAKGGAFRDEMGKQRGLNLDLDAGELDNNLANLNAAQDRSQVYHNARITNTNQRRTNTQQDFAGRADLADRGNADDSFGMDARNNRIDRGLAFRTAQLNARTGAGQQLVRGSQDRYDNYQRRGQGYSQDSIQGFQNTRDREAQNAGWLTKGLVSAGLGAASAFIPGAGAVAGGMSGGGGIGSMFKGLGRKAAGLFRGGGGWRSGGGAMGG